MQFEFYVLNYDVNKQQIINFNIFQNHRVNDETEQAIKKYLKGPENFCFEHYTNQESKNRIIYGFDALVETVKSIIMHEEWARREYEISVGDAFETDLSKLEKWDCYAQALPNIKIITRECLYQYAQQHNKGRS